MRLRQRVFVCIDIHSGVPRAGVPGCGEDDGGELPDESELEPRGMRSIEPRVNGRLHAAAGLGCSAYDAGAYSKGTAP